jgi:hypothetical protein
LTRVSVEAPETAMAVTFRSQSLDGISIAMAFGLNSSTFRRRLT